MSLKIKQKGENWQLDLSELFEFESHDEFLEFISFLTKLKISNGVEENSGRKSMLKSIFDNSEEYDDWITEPIKNKPPYKSFASNVYSAQEQKQKNIFLDIFKGYMKNDKNKRKQR